MDILVSSVYTRPAGSECLTKVEVIVTQETQQFFFY